MLYHSNLMSELTKEKYGGLEGEGETKILLCVKP